MPTSVELRQQRAKLVADARAIVNKAESESNRSLTGEEQQEFDRLMSASEELRGKITEAERKETLDLAEAELRDPQGRRTERERPGQSNQVSPEDVRESLRAWCLWGTEHARSDADTLHRASRCGINLGGSTVSLRALAKGSGSTGGDAVPRGMMAAIEKAMKWYNPVRGRVRVLRTDKGEDIDWPRVSDTANSASIVAEAGTIAENVDPAFDKVTLKSWKYATTIVYVSVELLQDMVVDPETLLGELLGERMGRGQATHFVTGNGTTQPQGLATGATVAKELASGNALTFDDIIDLIYSVDRAYRANASFMMHDTTMATVVKIKDDEGRYLWQPGLQIGDPDRIKGYPVDISNDMTPHASDIDETDKIMLFGDISSGYVIRDVVSSTNVTRLNELRAATGQVGFVLLNRADGRYVKHAGCVKAIAGYDTP